MKLSNQGKREDENDVYNENNDSESDDLKKAIKMSLEEKKEDESGIKSDVTITTSSGGVYFSDIDDYNRLKQKQKKWLVK